MAKNIAVVAYINGVRFDPASVSVTAQDGGLVTFSVDVPAVAEWDLLPARSHCAIFYSDPVTNVWRFMVEGEYTGYSKSKAADSKRRRTLIFRGLHSMWDRVKIASVLGATNPGGLSSLVVNGLNVSCGAQSNLLGTTLAGFIDTAVSQSQASDASINFILLNIIDAFMQQSAVDSFYHFARYINKKVFTIDDLEIQKLLSRELTDSLLKNQLLNMATDQQLSSVLQQIEAMILYHHTPILNPPLISSNAQQFLQVATAIDDVQASLGLGDSSSQQSSQLDSGSVLAELLFVPNLLNVVPPACNVIFRSQVTDFDMTRSYLSEPTRVYAQPGSALAGGLRIPAFVLATSVENSEFQAQLNYDPTVANMDTSKNGASTIVTHGYPSPEELYKGIIPASPGNISIENTLAKLAATKPGTSPSTSGYSQVQQNSVINYMMACVRYHFDLARSAVRSTQVNCAFLPYLVAGFPCLVEDPTGPFYGIVASLTHTLQATGRASTTVLIGNIRESYVVPGKQRHSPMPSWVNSAFWAGNIDATYSKLFGTNFPSVAFPGFGLGAHAAMVPQTLIQTTQSPAAEFAPQQVDLDVLAQVLLNSPTYDPSGLFPQSESSDMTLADLMAMPGGDYQTNMLRYQFRPGVTITEYANFHGLDGLQGFNSAITNTTDPDSVAANLLPDNLVKSTSVGNPLFGAPVQLQFVGNTGTPAANQYGAYTAVAPDGKAGTISTFRQNAALQISARIKALITNG